jgi:hypothetical protein
MNSGPRKAIQMLIDTSDVTDMHGFNLTDKNLRGTVEDRAERMKPLPMFEFAIPRPGVIWNLNPFRIRNCSVCQTFSSEDALSRSCDQVTISRRGCDRAWTYLNVSP